ncbi:MAG: rRNA pseudouridine synthase [Kiritimatiellae bacterium]|nr:rRNA pseudouridine synthase [Kiritimatiellia bacterium]
MEERLQNILARAGVASRRASAAIIEEGRVVVNGNIVTEPGARFDSSQARILVDGKRLKEEEKKRTIILYKPVGVLSTMSDPFGGKTVADFIRGKIKERLVPIGRLDKDSEGMLLLSNDGNLALQLTHPRFEHEKTYIVQAAGKWNEEKLAVLRGRIEMPDGYLTNRVPVKVIKVRSDNITELEFRLREGRKRQIRYMCSAAHLSVVKLKRIAIGKLRLPEDLKPGEWRELKEDEICKLKA